VLSHPETADADHSGSIEMKESIALALALTVNNIGVGVAASVAGVSVWPATLLTFVTSLLAIKLGAGFGQQFIAGLLGLYASFLSGFVIFVVGLASLLA
jgi:putative sporulation protein YtaF